MSALPNIDVAELRRRLSVLAVAQQLVTGLKQQGREWVACCPFHQEKTPSFTVVPSKGFFHCFGCGAHGDAIGLHMRLTGLKFEEAIADLADEVGLSRDGNSSATVRRRPARRPAPRTQTKPQIERDQDRARRWALEIWRSAQPATATLVETYLRSRSIDLEVIGGVPASLRFHPALDSGEKNGHVIGPAMIAGVQGPDGKIVAVHRTFLSPDGRTKAAIHKSKLVLGQLCHGAIRLAPVDGDGMAVAEGIETGLSVLAEFRRDRDRTPVWVAISLTHLSGGGDPTKRSKQHPSKPGKLLPVPWPDMERPGVVLPPDIKRVLICADGDSERLMTETLIRRAYRRWQTEGRTCFTAWPPAGMDWNDVAQAKVTQNFGARAA